jgi:hypothetical protein
MPKDRKKKISTRSVNKRLYIVCEGEATEYNYFNHYIDDCNICDKLVDVRVIETGKNTGKELIGFLKEIRQASSDELWAVFDRNGYTKHPEAFNKAKANKIRIAFSSISFEYWILLHFEYTTRPFIKDDEIIRHLRARGYIDYDKSDKRIYKKVKDNIPKAVFGAKRVRKYQHEANPGSKIYEMNPYTNVDELLESIDKVGKEFSR